MNSSFTVVDTALEYCFGFVFFFFLTSTFLLHQHFEQVELSSQLCSSRSHSFQIILPTTGEKHTYKTKKAEIVFTCQGLAR